MSLNLLLQGPQFAFKEALRSACGLAAGVAYSLMHCMLALIWGQLETWVWRGSFPNSTTPSSLYCLPSPLRLSLSIQNGIVKVYMMGHWTATFSQLFFSIQCFLDVSGKWDCFRPAQRGVCMKLFHLCFSHVLLLSYLKEQFSSLVYYTENCVTFLTENKSDCCFYLLQISS